MRKRYVKQGQMVMVTMPYSEVCMHMRIAGEPMFVKLVHPWMAQLYDMAGREFSAPITTGEAGLFRDEQNRVYIMT
jgi:hypothetical protein